ncbi:kinase-like protein [Panus rudis PR-1116 ss-1]|nr:kinase-like protein [Panus rudis PR-1116 ss-1]
MDLVRDNTELTRCTGSPGDACNGIFPRKDYAGLCGRCVYMATLSEKNDVTMIAAVKTWGQCEDCGALGRHYEQGEKCAGCKQASQQGQPIPNQAASQPVRLSTIQATPSQDSASQALARNLQENTQRRRDLTNDRLRSFQVQGSLANRPSAITNPAMAKSLSRPNSGSRNITVVVDPRVGKRVSTDLGRITIPFPADMQMPDVHSHIIDSLNIQSWSLLCSKDLIADDTFLRWKGNVLPMDGSLLLTLGEFYDLHYSATNHAIYFGKAASKSSKTRPDVHLELVISDSLFEGRTGMPIPQQLGGGIKARRAKRARRNEDSDSDAVNDSDMASVVTKHKKSRHGAPLVSSFHPATQMRAAQETMDTVRLRLATTNLSAQGRFTVDWQPEDSQIVVAQIQRVPAASGRMKHAYKAEVRMGDGTTKQYMAKRFFHTGQGDEEPVTVTGNRLHLYDEANCASLAKLVLENFYAYARKNEQAEVADNFVVTDYLLATEIIDDNGPGPSKASGVSKTQYEEEILEDPDTLVAWLLEPLRSIRVNKYSGTNAHPNHSGKLGQTLNAFAHFSYIWSKKTFVFTDLQATETAVRGEGTSIKRVNVLFDLMMHTKEGKSGLGDHGESGIEEFLKQHTCMEVCKDLGLDNEDNLLGDENHGAEDKSDDETAGSQAGSDMELED